MTMQVAWLELCPLDLHEKASWTKCALPERHFLFYGDVIVRFSIEVNCP